MEVHIVLLCFVEFRACLTFPHTHTLKYCASQCIYAVVDVTKCNSGKRGFIISFLQQAPYSLGRFVVMAPHLTGKEQDLLLHLFFGRIIISILFKLF